MADTLEDAYRNHDPLGMLRRWWGGQQRSQNSGGLNLLGFPDEGAAQPQAQASTQPAQVSRASIVPMPQRSPWQTQQVQAPQQQVPRQSSQDDLSQAVRSPAPALRPTAPSVPAGGPAAAAGQAQYQEPYDVAAMRLNRELAKSVAPAQAQWQAPNFSEVGGAGGQYYQSPQYSAWQANQRNARADLFRKYHGGWDPGEYQQLQNMNFAGGGQGKAGGDLAEQFLRRKIQNPTASYEGGIPVNRGMPTRTAVVKDVDGNQTVVNIPVYTSMGEFADVERTNAMERMAALERNRAEVAAADPNKQADLLDKLAADPRRLGTYLAGRGHDPEIARRIPSPAGVPAYGLGNLEQAAQDPETAYLHQALGPDSQLDLPRKLDLASRLMESGNPKYKDYMRGWLQRQQALDENWRRDVGGILNAPQTAEGINQSGIMHFLGGLMGADREQELARNRRARQVLQMFPELAGQPNG